MINQILLGDRLITYELTRKKVKNINLRIRPDLSISVSVNPRVKQEFIENFILSKSEWILKSIQCFESRKRTESNEPLLVNGEKVKLLGINYRLQLIPSKVNRIALEHDCICLYARDTKDINMVKRIWNQWLESFIKETYTQIVFEVYPRFDKYHINMPVIKIRSMKIRWGTCAVYKGVITLNKTLIHMPKECIEYVAAHELTHFLYPDHSKNFYQMLSIVMPDHKRRKGLLQNQAVY